MGECDGESGLGNRLLGDNSRRRYCGLGVTRDTVGEVSYGGRGGAVRSLLLAGLSGASVVAAASSNGRLIALVNVGHFLVNNSLYDRDLRWPGMNELVYMAGGSIKLIIVEVWSLGGA